jgi:hypothetical protein
MLKYIIEIGATLDQKDSVLKLVQLSTATLIIHACLPK